MSDITIPNEEQKEVALVVKAANALNVKTLEQVMDAADLLLDIKTVGEKITARKEEITKRLNEALKSARSLFRPFEEQFSEAEAIVKSKVLDWHQAHWNEETRTDNTVRGTRGKVTVVERFTVEIDDADAIPRNLCNPDIDRVKKALEAGIKVKGARLVPGYTIAAAKN
jgi:hypothetical protein